MPCIRTLLVPVECLLAVLMSYATPRLRAQELVNAQRDLALARQQLWEYRYVSFPRQRRSLDDQIQLAEAEIRVLHGRLKDYRQFLLIGKKYSPVRTAAENYGLELLATQQRLRQLKDDRINLWRISRQTYQLQELDVVRAARRLVAVQRGAAAKSSR